MFYQYVMIATRQIIEVSAPDRETGEARVKELLAQWRAGGHFVEDYDPKWFKDLDTDYRVIYNDR